MPRPKVALGREATHPVTIHQPERLERLRLGDPAAAAGGARAAGMSTARGASAGTAHALERRSVSVSCDTCHSLRAARDRPFPETMQQLQAFHQGLELKHGTLRCAACHTEGVLPKLHLADGRSLERSQAMELCQQCHGPQFRDYLHGSHGGMTGYWDLRQGPRMRNHCVDCHDPHAPAIRPVVPAPKPRDRFFGTGPHPIRAGVDAVPATGAGP